MIPPRVNSTRTNTTKTDPPKQDLPIEEPVDTVTNDQPKEIGEIIPVTRDQAIKKINNSSSEKDIIEKITPEAKTLLMIVLISGFIAILGVCGLVFYYYKTEFGEVP